MELFWSVTEWTVIENDMLGHHRRLRGWLGHGVGKQLASLFVSIIRLPEIKWVGWKAVEGGLAQLSF